MCEAATHRFRFRAERPLRDFRTYSVGEAISYSRLPTSSDADLDIQAQSGKLGISRPVGKFVQITDYILSGGHSTAEFFINGTPPPDPDTMRLEISPALFLPGV